MLCYNNFIVTLIVLLSRSQILDNFLNTFMAEMVHSMGSLPEATLPSHLLLIGVAYPPQDPYFPVTDFQLPSHPVGCYLISKCLCSTLVSTPSYESVTLGSGL